MVSITPVLFLFLSRPGLEVFYLLLDKKRILRGFDLSLFAIFFTRLFGQFNIQGIVVLLIALIYVTADKKLNFGFGFRSYYFCN